MTYTRRKHAETHTDIGRVDLLNISKDDIDVDTILKSLCHQPRYNGHGAVQWTVGQHTLAMVHYTRNVPGFSLDDRRLWLTHDWHEAYTGDIISPMKDLLGRHRVREIERRVDAAIWEHIGWKPSGTGHLNLDKETYHCEAYMLFNEEVGPMIPDLYRCCEGLVPNQTNHIYRALRMAVHEMFPHLKEATNAA